MLWPITSWDSDPEESMRCKWAVKWLFPSDYPWEAWNARWARVCLEACALHFGCLTWMAHGKEPHTDWNVSEQLAHPHPLCKGGKNIYFLHLQLCLTIAGLHRKWHFFPLCSRCFGCQRDILRRFLAFIKKIQLYQLLVIKRVRFYLKFKYSLIGFNLFICFMPPFPP